MATGSRPPSARRRRWASPVRLFLAAAAAAVAVAAAAAAAPRPTAADKATPTTPTPPRAGPDESPPWSYNNAGGWPASCRNSSQSPMPLIHVGGTGNPHRGEVADLLSLPSALHFTAHAADAEHVSLLCDGSCGTITVRGVAYQVKNLHWHTPAEHTVDGRRTAAELHAVSFAADGRIAVLASLFKDTKDNPIVQATIDAMVGLGTFEATLQDYRKYFYSGGHVGCGIYAGSLTTPPCTEGLTWVVSTKVGYMSEAQVEAIRALNGGHDNARPLQPINDRPVDWIDPEASGGR